MGRNVDKNIFSGEDKKHIFSELTFIHRICPQLALNKGYIDKLGSNGSFFKQIGVHINIKLELRKEVSRAITSL